MLNENRFDWRHSHCFTNVQSFKLRDAYHWNNTSDRMLVGPGITVIDSAICFTTNAIDGLKTKVCGRFD